MWAVGGQELRDEEAITNGLLDRAERDARPDRTQPGQHLRIPEVLTGARRDDRPADRQ